MADYYEGCDLKTAPASPIRKLLESSDSEQQELPDGTIAMSIGDNGVRSVYGVPATFPPGDSLEQPSSCIRSWRQLCVLGQGASATVWLCDWLSPLPQYATSLGTVSTLSRWGGSRLVALKQMTRRWSGSLSDFRSIKELESLLHIPRHDNIVNIYDCFFSPTTYELFMVFEFMEGNLHHLLQRRRTATHPLSEGLVASIFAQTTRGLHHIHTSGYMHRDLKPENVLVSTTGFAYYASTSSQSQPSDLTVAVKIADFGLSRETTSHRPCTGYVATRWYRAPEVLLRDPRYSQPVDIWALGLILVELVNLEPLFPGRGELDQLNRISRVLGYPASHFNSRGRLVGGGPWASGVIMAESLGFVFRKCWPISLSQVMKASVSRDLLDCAEDMLRYDPQRRLTTGSLLEHPYVTNMI